MPLPTSLRYKEHKVRGYHGADVPMKNPVFADVPAPAVRGSGSLYALDLMAAYNRNMSAYDMVSNSTPAYAATTFTYDASGDMPGAKLFFEAVLDHWSMTVSCWRWRCQTHLEPASFPSAPRACYHIDQCSEVCSSALSAKESPQQRSALSWHGAAQVRITLWTGHMTM